MERKQFNQALILLQDYDKNVSYLCSPDQAIIKTLHLYLLGLCRFSLGIPGVILLCDQALGLSERADKRSANYGSLTVALQLHLCFLRAKVFVKNGPADNQQLAKGIAALRHVIQQQMPMLRKSRAKNIRGTAKNPNLVKHLQLFKEFDLDGAKSLYAESLMLSGRFDNAARVYQGLIKQNEDILHDQASITCLLNYHNQLGNCLSKLKKFEQSLKCYLKSRNIIRSYGLNVSAPIKAKILSNIATLYLNLDCGREREAIELLQESLELKKRALEVNNSSLIQGYMLLGKGCLKLPLFGKACKSYKEALQLAIFEGQPELTISIILDYSKALKGSGKSKEAVNLIESAIDQGRNTTPIDTLFRAWQILLDLYLEMNSLSKAKILMRTIYAHLDSKKQELGSVGGLSKLPDLYTKLALAFKTNNQTQEALLVFLKAYSLFKGFKPIKRNPECERYLSLLQEIADCYVELCLYRQAEKYLNQALKILKQFAPNNNPLLDNRCGAIFHKLGQVSLKKDKTVFNRDNALYYFKQAEKCFTCTPWNEQRRDLLNEIKREIVNIKLAKSLTLSLEQA